MEALIAAGVVFALSLGGLMLLEVVIHKLTKNRSTAYRPGVFVLAVLLAIYAYLTSVGR
jgi:hypothetical protein